MIKRTGIALIALTALGAFQSYQLRMARIESAALEQDLRSAQSRELVFTRGIVKRTLRSLDEGVQPPSGDEPDRVYAVVDTKCGACRVALEQLAQVSHRRAIYLTSFHDPPTELAGWARQFGGAFKVLQTLPSKNALAGLELDATPLYLEYSAGTPSNVYLGAPPEQWLNQEGL